MDFDQDRVLQNMFNDYAIVEHIRVAINARMKHFSEYKAPSELINDYMDGFIDYNEFDTIVSEFIKECEIYIYYISVQISIARNLYNENYKITQKDVLELESLEETVKNRLESLNKTISKVVTERERDRKVKKNERFNGIY